MYRRGGWFGIPENGFYNYRFRLPAGRGGRFNAFAICRYSIGKHIGGALLIGLNICLHCVIICPYAGGGGIYIGIGNGGNLRGGGWFIGGHIIGGGVCNHIGKMCLNSGLNILNGGGNLRRGRCFRYTAND